MPLVMTPPLDVKYISTTLHRSVHTWYCCHRQVQADRRIAGRIVWEVISTVPPKDLSHQSLALFQNDLGYHPAGYGGPHIDKEYPPTTLRDGNHRWRFFHWGCCD